MNNKTATFIATLPYNKAIVASKQIEEKSKSVGAAYALMLLPAMFWVSGCHKFYQGKIGEGVAYMLTLGYFGLGNLWDLFTLPSQIREYNEKVEAEVVAMFSNDVEDGE